MKMTSSAVMKALFSKSSLCLFSLATLLGPFPAFAMVEMKDEQLSEVTGQALLQMGKTPSQTGSDNLTFYKAGLDAQLELNMNIERLQLGCGGVNGAGCDIDIDHLSLSGADDCPGGRPNCSGILTRPYFEFAIKNDHSKTLREVVGMRLSAEETVGMLSFGTNNSSAPNGINTFSGYMKVQSDESGMIRGNAYTEETFFDAGVHQVTGRLQALGLGGAAEVEFITTEGGFTIPAMCNSSYTGPCGLEYVANGVTVNNSRVTGIGGSNPNNPNPVQALLDLPTITLSTDGPSSGNAEYDPVNNAVHSKGGLVTAEVTSCKWLACVIARPGDEFDNVLMEGQIINATTNVIFTESLGFIHKLPVNSPFYLSMQKEAVKWPGSQTDDTAQAGWWMSFKNPVNVGPLNPTDPVDITPLFPQIASQISDHLAGTPAETTDLGGLLGSGSLTTEIGTPNLAGNPLDLYLNDIPLATQNFNANCYGSARFC